MRTHGFSHRHHTEHRLPNRLWRLGTDRLNYQTPTNKPTSDDTDRNLQTRLLPLAKNKTEQL